VTAVNDLPNQIGSSTSGVDWPGKNPEELALLSYQFADFNFVETFGIEIIQGRSFSRQIAADSSGAFLVNEAAVRLMGFDEPIGKQMRWWNTEGTIIGVMEDFHISSLRSEIQPHIVRIEPSQLRDVCVKYNEGDVQPVLASLESEFRNFYPDGAFEYHFFDETFEAQYRAEQRMGDIFKFVAILSIFIACLGLFGLSAFMAEQRTKEIGIRKALGATLTNIVTLISQEFVQLALIANLIAIPAAWYFMRQWLTNFAYHMDLNLWIFLGAAAAALTMVMITVSINGLKAGRINPAHSLKYE
jgi:hypothetical protein